jgi:hypothetical protein
MDLDGTQVQVLKALRQELFDEGILHDGDTIGTDDETLLYVHDCSFDWYVVALNCCCRRFLRARKFNFAQTKTMIQDCQEWRRTVEGVGIDELYKRIDPFDVSDFC